MGGMHVLEWCVLYKEMIGNAVCVASCLRCSAWGIAWNEMQRQCIWTDPAFRDGFYYRDGGEVMISLYNHHFFLSHQNQAWQQQE